jgi:DnaJ-class molecular chaperone
VIGSCDVCGGVSVERQREFNSKRPKCELCKGTGREKSRTSNESRECPMCYGKGYRNY